MVLSVASIEITAYTVEFRRRYTAFPMFTLTTACATADKVGLLN